MDKTLTLDRSARRILIAGDTAGMFGRYRDAYIDDRETVDLDVDTLDDTVCERIQYISDMAASGARIDVMARPDTVEYYRRAFRFIFDSARFPDNIMRKQTTIGEPSSPVRDSRDLRRMLSSLPYRYDYIIAGRDDGTIAACRRLLAKGGRLDAAR